MRIGIPHEAAAEVLRVLHSAEVDLIAFQRTGVGWMAEFKTDAPFIISKLVAAGAVTFSTA